MFTVCQKMPPPQTNIAILMSNYQRSLSFILLSFTSLYKRQTKIKVCFNLHRRLEFSR